MNEDKLYYFSDYHKGVLPEDELKTFEKNLQENVELQKEYEIFLCLIEGVKQFEKDRLKKHLKSLQGNSVSKPLRYYKKERLTVKLFLSIAASVIILAVPGYYLYRNMNRSANLYNEFHVKDPGLPLLMGDSRNTFVNKAMLEFKEDKFDAAYNVLNELVSKEPANDTLNYYSGVCLMELNKYDAAITSFKKVKDKNGSLYFLAKYNLALVYIKNKKYFEAKNELANLKGIKHTLTMKADKLYQELD